MVCYTAGFVGLNCLKVGSTARHSFKCRHRRHDKRLHLIPRPLTDYRVHNVGCRHNRSVREVKRKRCPAGAQVQHKDCQDQVRPTTRNYDTHTSAGGSILGRSLCYATCRQPQVC
ncbi:unnamed protein product, partial [Callosobruchus maculatus]